MNRSRVAALLRELADELEADDVERDIKPEKPALKPPPPPPKQVKVDAITRREIERNLRNRGYPLPQEGR